MVPGVAEREIRHHANHRQEWLLSESTHSVTSLSGDRTGTRVVVISALARAQQAIAKLVRRGSTGEAQLERAQPIRLGPARQ